MHSFTLVLLWLPSLLVALAAPSSHSLRRRHPQLKSQRSHVARSAVPNRAPVSSFVTSNVKLPLKPLSVRSSDGSIHPQILLQQHLNRGLRRHARMAGHPEPSTEELTMRLRKRVLSIESQENEKRLRKRWRGGKAMGGLTGLTSAISSLFSNTPVGRQAQSRISGSSSAASGNNDNEASAAGSASSTTNSTSDGFSRKAFEAARTSAVTKAAGTLADNSLGLDV